MHVSQRRAQLLLPSVVVFFASRHVLLDGSRGNVECRLGTGSSRQTLPPVFRGWARKCSTARRAESPASILSVGRWRKATFFPQKPARSIYPSILSTRLPALWRRILSWRAVLCPGTTEANEARRSGRTWHRVQGAPPPSNHSKSGRSRTSLGPASQPASQPRLSGCSTSRITKSTEPPFFLLFGFFPRYVWHATRSIIRRQVDGWGAYSERSLATLRVWPDLPVPAARPSDWSVGWLVGWVGLVRSSCFHHPSIYVPFPPLAVLLPAAERRKERERGTARARTSVRETGRVDGQNRA